MAKPRGNAAAEVVVCEIVPRQDAAPDRLKALGRAITRWQQHVAAAEGCSFDPEFEGVNDLLHGELPKPLALRAAAALRKEGEPVGQPVACGLRGLTEVLGYGRTVIIVVTLRERQRLSQAAADIIGALPADVLTAVLIDGESWRLIN